MPFIYSYINIMYFSKPHLIRYCILIERNDAIHNNPSELLCSCLDALRHPFLCGPRWRVVPSMDIIRWGLGSTAVRIAEEYIYGQPQVYVYFLNPISWFLFSFKLSIPPWWIGSHCCYFVGYVKTLSSMYLYVCMKRNYHKVPTLRV